jgi:uncharacterized protein YndB with AHSA1/START domain
MNATIPMGRREADREFALTHILNAPRELVFKAWTDPDLLPRWWAPEGFTVPLCEIDARTGGAYRIVMRSPEGDVYPLKGVYIDIRAPERLVFTDNWEEHPSEWQAMLPKNNLGESHNTVMFENIGNKTMLILRSVFDSIAVRDAMLKMGTSEGWWQSFERLDRLLA